MRATLLLFYLFYVLIISYGIIVHEDGKKFIVFTNEKTSKEDITIGIIIGVGTGCENNYYTLLAENIVSQSPGALFAIMDPNPGNPTKDSESQYADTYEIVKSWVEKENYPIEKWYIGGHSASGQAAAKALLKSEYQELFQDVHGFIGFDPFCAYDKTIAGKCFASGSQIHVNKPALFWSFTTESCGVDPTKFGGAKFYDFATYPSDSCNSHELYQFYGSYDKRHCIFTNTGCPFGNIPIISPILGLNCGPNTAKKNITDSAISSSIKKFISNDFSKPSDEILKIAHFSSKESCSTKVSEVEVAAI